MARMSLNGIRKSFGTVDVLHGIDLDIDDREFIVFVGPSGCGKSTLLRLIAGLDAISAGEFHIEDRRMNDVAPSRRGIAMVFQSYALYPHMDVYENMAFGVRLLGLDKAEIEQRIQEASKMLKLDPLMKRKPRELSGGQRQRVAIGRALVRKPKVLLLDEPLSNLDAALRSDVRLEIARLHREIGGTTIYVTHDQVEAMTLADRIVVINNGKVEQFGSPRELYERPANTFVATFIGSPRMALLDVIREGDRVTLEGSGSITLPRLPASSERELVIGVRPDAFSVSTDEAAQGFRGQVVYTEYLGENTYIYIRLADGALIGVSGSSEADFKPDMPVTVAVDPQAVHFFSRTTRERLSV